MVEIKVKVELTEGYQKRFTEAFCKILAGRNAMHNPIIAHPEKKEKQSAAEKTA